MKALQSILFLLLMCRIMHAQEDSVHTFKIKKSMLQPDAEFVAEDSFPTYSAVSPLFGYEMVWENGDQIVISYPAGARRSGKVHLLVGLIIGEKIITVQVEKGVEPILDKAAVDHVMNMDRKRLEEKLPVKREGMRVLYALTVRFSK